MAKKTKVRDWHFGMICICAIRYALGRRTYIVGVVCDYIRAKFDDIETSDLLVMIRDIKEASDLGDDCDEADWTKLRDAMEQEVEERKEKE